MTGGWVAAAGMLAGLYAQAVARRRPAGGDQPPRRRDLLHSGVFLRDGELVAGPSLDAAQTGYGPGYRIYECGDGQLAGPGGAVRRRRGGGWPCPSWRPSRAQYAPLRGGARTTSPRPPRRCWRRRSRPRRRRTWVTGCARPGSLAELIEPPDRDGFRRGILDDPVNRQLGRVVAYTTADWGRFEQIGPLVRYGPAAGAGPRLMLPGVGEHTVEVLAELGFSAAQTGQLLEAKVARQLPG